MKFVQHDEIGNPALVLRVMDAPARPLAAGEARVKVLATPKPNVGGPLWVLTLVVHLAERYKRCDPVLLNSSNSARMQVFAHLGFHFIGQGFDAVVLHQLVHSLVDLSVKPIVDSLVIHVTPSNAWASKKERPCASKV